MNLTRRDALAALVAGGVVTGTLSVSELLVARDDHTGAGDLTEADIATAQGVATIVFPETVDVSEDFVEAYFSGFDTERRRRTVRAIRDLRAATRREHGADLSRISRSDGDAVLRSMGVDRVKSNPDGTVPERVRYYLVNGLLYALFTTPKGASLFGIDNPLGYPGGFATYRAQVEGRGSEG